jgi:hypothetical protein
VSKKIWYSLKRSSFCIVSEVQFGNCSLTKPVSKPSHLIGASAANVDLLLILIFIINFINFQLIINFIDDLASKVQTSHYCWITNTETKGQKVLMCRLARVMVKSYFYK